LEGERELKNNASSYLEGCHEFCDDNILGLEVFGDDGTS
jgi:hypothetical protein